MSTTPPAVAFKSLKTKNTGPHEGVGGFDTCQFKFTYRGTRSDMSYVGVEGNVGTVTGIFKQGEYTYTVNPTYVVLLFPIVD